MSSIPLPKLEVWWLLIADNRNVLRPRWTKYLVRPMITDPVQMSIVLTKLGVTVKYQPPFF